MYFKDVFEVQNSEENALKTITMQYLILVFIFPVLQCLEIFESVSLLKNLFENEIQSVLRLNEYQKSIKECSNTTNQQLKNLERISRLKLLSPDDYLKNPLNQFSLVKRFVYFWNELNEEIKSNCRLNLFEKKFVFPNHKDMLGTFRSILRLQHTYKLKTEDLVNGQLFSQRSIKAFNVYDCVNLGVQAQIMEKFEYCYDWLFISYELLNCDNSNSERCNHVIWHLAYCSFQTFKLSHMKFLLDRLFVKSKHSKNKFMLLTNIYKDFEAQDDDDDDEDDDGESDDEFSTYEKLCRSEKLEQQTVNNNLKCYLWTNKNNPRLVISPFKIEELSKEPHIVRFYSVVTDMEADKIVEKAQKDLSRALVGYGVKVEVSNERICEVSWLEEHKDAILKPIIQRIGDLTGLDLTNSESLQAANYGLAGHFEPHDDALGDAYTPNDRIATFLIYLSDVEFGGSTVFVRPLVIAKPAKGDALLWFNKRPNGNIAFEAKHAGCPVAIGNKWVVTKWVNYHDNLFAYRCIEHNRHSYTLF